MRSAGYEGKTRTELRLGPIKPCRDFTFVTSTLNSESLDYRCIDEATPPPLTVRRGTTNFMLCDYMTAS